MQVVKTPIGFRVSLESSDLAAKAFNKSWSHLQKIACCSIAKVFLDEKAR